MTTYVKQTFEMLWDCPACDRAGNLGVTHKFCPGCGHPQGAERRYFPTPGQRLDVAPPSSGRQVTCSHCSVLNDPSHACCQACGARLAGSAPVQLRPSIPEHAGETGADARRTADVRAGLQRLARESARVRADRAAQHEPEPPTEPWAGEAWTADLDADASTLTDYGINRFGWSAQQWAIAAACSVIAVFILLVLFWKKDIEVEVQGHTWSRTISVERFKSVHDSAWCSSKPSDAYNVSRRSELHHVNHVPDGQTCRTVPGSESCRNVDNGNGSGSTVCTRTPSRQECTTKYRDDPVYADKCYFDVDRWRHQRNVVTSGSRLQPSPAWPEPEFRSCAITRLGCERLGPRTQQYIVHFVSAEADRKTFECEYPQPKWERFRPGSMWSARVGVIWERLDCGSLELGRRGAQ